MLQTFKQEYFVQSGAARKVKMLALMFVLFLVLSSEVLADQTQKQTDVKVKPDIETFSGRPQDLRRHFLPSSQTDFVPDRRQNQPWSYSHLPYYFWPCTIQCDRCSGSFFPAPPPHSGGQYEHYHGRHYLSPHQVALK